MDEQLEPVEMRLMTLGAMLVGTNEKAAHIVADAMSYIDELKRQLHELRKQQADRTAAKARARRPR
jgi:hypothetical protein